MKETHSNEASLRSTTTKRPIDSRGDERDLDCTPPIKGMLPPSPMRRAGFTDLRDIVI